MRFIDTHCERDLRFSIGREAVSGKYYLSIPVSSGIVDYEEFYEISQELHDGYPGNVDALTLIANRCRARECDDRLFMKPGTNRGVAC